MFSKKLDNDDKQEEDDFRCPKCKWFFSTKTKPYILPCNHHICLKCIDQLIIENKTLCPICKTSFNKEERNSFQINIVFLNILIKILQSKIILCKNCNKIFYWKEHYNICDQSFFIETNELFNQLKITCEEGIKALKLFNSKSSILYKYKYNIFTNIKKAIKEISEFYKKEINLGIKKLFFTPNKIEFSKNKKEMVSFLQICLPYNNYFDENEIMNILEKYYPYDSPKKKKKTNNQSKNILELSPNAEIVPFSPYFEKNINHFPAKKTSSLMIPQMCKGYKTIIINKNDNQKNNFRLVKNNNNRNNNLNFMKEDQSFNMLNKIVNDNINIKNINNNINNINNNIYNIKNHINTINNNISNINNSINKFNNLNHYNNINKLRKDFYMPRKNSNTVVIYNSSTKPKKKKNKFNIYEILNEDEPNEENDKKKIIVGLKDVKIISNNLNKKVNDNKSRNIIHRENKSTNVVNNSKINNYKSSNKNLNNINIIDDESDASTIRIEIPSLSVLRSTEFTKRIFPLNADDKRKKLLKYQQACLNLENEQNLMKNKIDKINNKKKNVNKIGNSNSLISLNNKNDNIDSQNNNKSNKNKIAISSMNKLFKHFNKIRDIVNELNNYYDFLSFISDYINKDVEFRLLTLSNIILNDYSLLLNEITYNYSQSYRHSLISFSENSKKISIYNTNLKNFKTKDFEKILPQNKALDKSMSIDFDDIDLIFISGGTDDSKYYCTNKFIILRWSTEKIEYSGTLPERRAFHSTLYYDNKLYLIGGIDSNKKVSKECHVFSLADKKWHNLPNLNVGRANSSICIYNNKVLYVFRGRDDNDIIDSIEYIKLFNLRSSWKILKLIDYGYVWNSAENSLVMTVDKGKIIICGGEDKNGNLLKDTFLFEINTKKIYKGLDLAFPASFKSHGCCNKGKFFCVDFKNENNFNFGNGNVHIFDEKENIWTFE